MPCGATNSGPFFSLLFAEPEIKLTDVAAANRVEPTRKTRGTAAAFRDIELRAGMFPSLLLKPFLRKRKIGEMSFVFAVKNYEDWMPHV